MSAITPEALALLFRVKGDNEMIHVTTKDSSGYVFSGRVLDVTGQWFDIEAEDGELVYDVQVRRIMSVDVRPLVKYSGYGVAQFVSEFGPGVS